MSEKETSRIEAFSDAVFAVAITLLVLDLKVPQAADHPSAAAMLKALVNCRLVSARANAWIGDGWSRRRIVRCILQLHYT